MVIRSTDFLHLKKQKTTKSTEVKKTGLNNANKFRLNYFFP